MRYRLVGKKTYNVRRPGISRMESVEKFEGETIEAKCRRVTKENEPIKDGAPEIFTERSEGVIAAYNIRTDRFEIAADAMDKVARSQIARRDAKAEPGGKVVDMKPEGGDVKGGDVGEA